MVGRVIGKGGETIKALQKNFGANIQIDQSTEPMKVTVSGQPQAVELALSAVQEIISGGSPYLGPGSGGFGAPLACPVSLSSALSLVVTLMCVPVHYKEQRVWCGVGLARTASLSFVATFASICCEAAWEWPSVGMAQAVWSSYMH